MAETRVTTTGVSVLAVNATNPVPKARVTTTGVSVLALVPDGGTAGGTITTPTLSVGAVTASSANLTGTAFSDTEPTETHASSDWQVQEAGGDWSVLAFESLADASNLTSITATGLGSETNYEARVRYNGSLGAVSEWSTPEPFTTGVAPGTITTPTIAASAITTTRVTLTGSAFSDTQPLESHASSEWQIQLAGGDWSAPVFDSGADAVHLTAIDVTGLTPDTAYEARVAYNGSLGATSAWSTAEPFSTSPAGTSSATRPERGQLWPRGNA
ncbi:MAG TPA: hypothetical protein VFK04_13015 [Gemmatimonadaceae bacterium]|nr:hypothetical protein [Gemmatimonadaceae bacterium]